MLAVKLAPPDEGAPGVSAICCVPTGPRNLLNPTRVCIKILLILSHFIASPRILGYLVLGSVNNESLLRNEVRCPKQLF